MKLLKRCFSVLKPIEADKLTNSSTTATTITEGSKLPLESFNYTGETNHTFCEKRLYVQYQGKFRLIILNKLDTFDFQKQSKVIVIAITLNLLLTLK